jgi:hypothetical protein
LNSLRSTSSVMEKYRRDNHQQSCLVGSFDGRFWLRSPDPIANSVWNE